MNTALSPGGKAATRSSRPDRICCSYPLICQPYCCTGTVAFLWGQKGQIGRFHQKGQHDEKRADRFHQERHKARRYAVLDE